jgi:hypothetical protein
MSKVKNKINLRLALVLTFIFTMMMGITALADEKDDAKNALIAMASNGDNISSYVSDTSTSYKNPVMVSINNVPYYFDGDKASEIITAYNNSVATANANTADAQVISDMRGITNGMEIKANTTKAYDLLGGFIPAIQTLLGILVVLITVGTTIFTGLDVAYIAFPTFRNKCEDQKASGSGVFASPNKSAGGETKLRFISDEAQYAVNQAQTLETGKNPLIIYFSKRVVAYMVLAVVLFIFLTGRVTVFTDLALNVVSGVINIIQGAS